MNKGKPTPGGNFSNVNYFQSGRQNQPHGNRNVSGSNNNGGNNNRFHNNNQNNNSPNNNNKSGSSSNNSNIRLKPRVRNDQRNSPNKFIKNINNSNNNNGMNNNRSFHNNNNNNANGNFNNGNGPSCKQNFTNSNTNINNNFNTNGNNNGRAFNNNTFNSMNKIPHIPSKPMISNIKPVPTNVLGSLAPTSSSSSTSNNTQVDSNNFETKFFGTLLQQAENYGFKKLSRRPQKVAKYMLQENVLFDMSTYQPNHWDVENQQMLVKREIEYSGEPQLLFEEFQEHRKVEREMMEKFNLVDKENAKKSLDDAIIFRGSCQDMCPTYERVERVFKNQVSKWEKDPQTNKISRYQALKTFMRPSGQAPPLPSDVRAPDVLQKTLNYIIENLLPKLPESQSFIWDRTRSIRQDFTFQNNYSGFESIDCHEKICRIHILSLHVMAGANDPDYQQQQEVEQFNNSLQTLTHMYNDIRSRGGFCPNEPEFRSYELISKIKDHELDRYLQTLPEYIQDDPIVQRTIMLRNLIIDSTNHFNLFSDFFKGILDKSKTPFLLAALAEIHFNEIRYNALRSLSRTYHQKSRKLPEVSYIASALGYNDSNQLEDTLKLYQIPTFFEVNDNEMRVEVAGLKSAFKGTQKQAYTHRITEMMNGMSLANIVNNGKVNKDLHLKRPQTLEQIARESFKGSKQNSKNVNDIFSHNKGIKFSKPNQSVKPELFDNTSVNVAVDSLSNNAPIQNAFNFPPSLSDTKSFATNSQISAPPVTQSVFGTVKPFNFTRPAPQTAPTTQSGNTTNFSFGNNGPKSEASTPNRPADIFFKQITNQQVVNPVSIPIEKPKPVETKLPEPEPEPVEPPKKLVDNPAFKTGASKVADKLIVDYVTKLSNAVTQQKIEQEKKKRAQESKARLVATLSEELFTAFMKEQIYLTVLNARATAFYNKSLKQKVIQKVVSKAKIIAKKKEETEALANEIKAFNDKVVVSYPKLTLPVPVTIPVIQEKDVAPQFRNLESNVLDIFNKVGPSIDMNGVVVLRDPKSVSSSWLVSQLGLNNEKKSVSVKNEGGRTLHLELLPEKFESKDYFANISTIVVQVGTVEGVDTPKKSTLIRCLQRDTKVISKLATYLKEYSSAPLFSLVIVYVDAYRIGLPDSDIKKILKIDSLSSSKITVGFFKMNNSYLKSNNGLSSIRKLQLDFSTLLEKVWKKSFLKNEENITKAINYTSVIKNDTTNADSTINDTKKDILPSDLIKKRLKYLHSAIDTSQVKRRRISSSSRQAELSSYLINASMNSTINNSTQSSFAANNDVGNNSKVVNNSSMFKNRDLTGISGVNNSLMVLKNYKNLNDTINGTVNNSLLYGVYEVKDRKRMQELSELDELADSILKS